MKTWVTILAIISAAVPSTVSAQHLEVGGFGSYEHYDRVGLPSQEFGLGGRLDINLARYLQVELETSYDFKHENVDFASNVTSFTVSQSKMGVLHGNAGLKLQTAGGSFFLFVKGGANRFDTEFLTTTAIGFPSVNTFVQGTQGSFSKGVLYPGGGIGFHAGPLGIRLDAGDEIYWDNGARHNLRVTFGPTFRF